MAMPKNVDGSGARAHFVIAILSKLARKALNTEQAKLGAHAHFAIAILSELARKALNTEQAESLPGKL